MKSLDNNPRKKLALVIFFIVLVSLFLYGLFQARNLIIGPVITIKHPKNGETVIEKILDIEGDAHNIAFIRLNGRQIFVDDLGTFREKLILAPGYNTISLTATDKFGRDTENVLEIILETLPEKDADPGIKPATGADNNQVGSTTNQ